MTSATHGVGCSRWRDSITFSQRHNGPVWDSWAAPGRQPLDGRVMWASPSAMERRGGLNNKVSPCPLPPKMFWPPHNPFFSLSIALLTTPLAMKIFCCGHPLRAPSGSSLAHKSLSKANYLNLHSHLVEFCFLTIIMRIKWHSTFQMPRTLPAVVKVSYYHFLLSLLLLESVLSCNILNRNISNYGHLTIITTLLKKEHILKQ